MEEQRQNYGFGKSGAPVWSMIGRAVAPYLLPAGFFLVVFLPMLVAAGAVKQAAEPRLCASCHGKAAEKVVKKGPKLGAHDGIPCLTCHKDISKGLMGDVNSLPIVAVARAQAVEERSKKSQPKGKTATPGVKPTAAGGGGADNKEKKDDQVGAAKEGRGLAAVPDAFCERCHPGMAKHKPKEGASVTGAHDVHKKKGVACVQCHAKVVHGEVSQDGKRVSIPRPKMADCLSCHKKLTPVGSFPPKLVRCPTCHLNNLKPPFHDAEWYLLPTNHGPAAMDQKIMGIAVCEGCHGVQRIDDSLKEKDLADPGHFARNNFFCVGCHLNNRPPRHNDYWRFIHKTEALPNFMYCLVCHNQEQPKADKMATSVEERGQPNFWCGKCHNPKTPNGKHPAAAEWLPFHAKVVKEIGPVKAGCFNCHASDYAVQCQACHKSATAPELLKFYRKKMEEAGTLAEKEKAALEWGKKMAAQN